MRIRRAGMALVLGTFVWLTSCAGTVTSREDGPLRDWDAALKSDPDPHLFDSLGGDYFLLLHDTSHGDRSAIRYAIRLVSSKSAPMSALADDYAYIAELTYNCAYADGIFWDEVRLLGPERQQRIIEFLDATNRSECYGLDDWDTERELFLSNKTP